ncbi:MAG TPA: hypothetical protein VI524_02380 [Anaerolineales bacterium]|nr:hypothetical protein [Anaerolineales bacterium]
MNLQKLEMLPPPPGVIGSLRAGFDAVSSHVVLILGPLVLDMWLWLGPRLSVTGLLGPYFKFLFDQARNGPVSASDVQRIVTTQDLFMEALERFNLLNLLGKMLAFPIGVSSLLAGTLTVTTPYGEQKVLEVSSFLGFLGLVFLLTLAGWIAGALYFRWVSGTALGETRVLVSSGRAIAQTVLLSVIWFVGLGMLMAPVLFILTILVLVSPALANGALFIMLMLSFWVIVPLFFAPHGIFVQGQNAFYSVFSSLRMTRYTLPMSGMFVLCAFLLYRGLNYLWSVPPGDSWMMLVGIAGHAFITTALLAASFVYYRDVNVWLQTVFEQGKRNQVVPGRQV